jgi:hypothetical protein
MNYWISTTANIIKTQQPAVVDFWIQNANNTHSFGKASKNENDQASGSNCHFPQNFKDRKHMNVHYDLAQSQ